MNILLCVSMFATAMAAYPSTIGSGLMLTNYSFGMSDAPWAIQLTSGPGIPHYSVQYSTDGSTTLHCSNCDPLFPAQGTVASISGLTFSDFGEQGSATLNGVLFPSISFMGMVSSVFYRSGISFTSASFTMAPGVFDVPFSFTGNLYAIDPNGPALLFTDSVSGTGTMHFVLQPADLNPQVMIFSSQANASNSQLALIITPEPASVLLTGGLLFALLARAIVRRRR